MGEVVGEYVGGCVGRWVSACACVREEVLTDHMTPGRGPHGLLAPPHQFHTNHSQSSPGCHKSNCVHSNARKLTPACTHVRASCRVFAPYFVAGADQRVDGGARVAVRGQVLGDNALRCGCCIGAGAAPQLSSCQRQSRESSVSAPTPPAHARARLKAGVDVFVVGRESPCR